MRWFDESCSLALRLTVAPSHRALLLTSVLILTAPFARYAFGQDSNRQQNWDLCTGSDPDASIAGCTALIRSGVEFQIREVFESALVFGEETIKLLGATDEEAAEVMEGVRERDRVRFEAQLLDGLQAAPDLLLSNATEQAREQGITAPVEPVIGPEPAKAV